MPEIKNSKYTVVLVEPCYYGMGFLETVYSRGYNIIVVAASSDNRATESIKLIF